MCPRLSSLLFASVVLGSVLAQPKSNLPTINPNNAKLLRTIDGLGSPATAVAVESDKGLVVVGCEDGTLRLASLADGKGLLENGKFQTIKAHSSVVTSVAAGSALVASASSDGKVSLWNFPADKPAQTMSHGARVRAVAVSTDDKTVASAGDDNTVQLWDGAGKSLRKLTGPTDWLFAVAFSADGKFVAAGGQGGKLWLWETASGRKIFDVASSPPPANKKDPPAKNLVSALAFTPDGKTLALGGDDGKIYLYQSSDGKLLRTLTGHTHTITGLGYHPAGQVLVSSSKDRTVRLWNANGTNQLKSLASHTAWVTGVALADQGTRAVSVSADRTVRLWDLGAVPVKPKKK